MTEYCINTQLETLMTVLSKNVLTSLLGMTLALVLAGCSPPAESDAEGDHTDHGDHQHDGAEPKAEEQSTLPNYVAAPYPLDTCVVAGGKLGSMGKPITLVHKGREVKFCCSGCEPKFKADPDKYLKKIDAAVIEQQSAAYPMDTCLISGDKLGDKPTDFVYENRLVRLCCDMCVDTFLKNPNAHLAKLNDAAVKAQLADYPGKKCPVSGQDLGSMGKPIDMMVGHQLVRLCCAGCVEKTQANPVGMLDKVYGSPKAPDAE